MSEVAPKQLLHLVFGGELEDVAGVEFRDVANLDIVGVFPDYASARAAWKAKAQATVDNAQMRYFVVHLHRLLEPEAPSSLAHGAGERGFGAGIGLLPLDAPVAQLLERNRDARHRAAHEGAGADDAEVGVEEANLRLAGRRRSLVAVHEAVSSLVGHDHIGRGRGRRQAPKPPKAPARAGVCVLEPSDKRRVAPQKGRPHGAAATA